MPKKEKELFEIELPPETQLKPQVKISGEKLDELEKQLYADIENCANNKGTILTEIEKYKKALNIEPESENKVSPWDGCSNYCDMITSNHCEIIKSVLNRTIISDPIWLANIRFKPEYERFVQEVTNGYAFDVLDIEPKLRDAINTAVEERISFLEISDVAESTSIIETQEFLKIEDFWNTYPTPISAGLDTKQELRELQTDIANQIKEKKSGKIRVVKNIYDQKVVLNVYNLDETYILPLNSSSIETAKGIMFRIYLSDGELRKFADMDYFKKDVIEEILNTAPQVLPTEQEQQQDQRFGTEGQEINVKYEPRTIIKGLYTYEIDENVGEEEFYIYFLYNERKIIRIEKYERTAGMRDIIDIKILPIHNEIIPDCVAKRLYPIQNLKSTLWNQIIDNNSVANVPLFVASIDERKDKESSLNSAQSRDTYPGAIIWLKNKAAFSEINTRALDSRGMLDFLNVLTRDAEINTGAIQMLSGRENPSDPNAPGNKTAMQLNQATMRIDDYLKVIRPSIDKLGKILFFKLNNTQPNYYKNYQIMFTKENTGSTSKAVVVPQEVSVTEVIMQMNGQSVELNRDTIINEQLFLQKYVMPDPQIQANPKAKYISYNKLLSNMKSLRRKEIDQILEILFNAFKQAEAGGGANMPNLLQPPPEPPRMNEGTKRLIKEAGIPLEEPK